MICVHFKFIKNLNFYCLNSIGANLNLNNYLKVIKYINNKNIKKIIYNLYNKKIYLSFHGPLSESKHPPGQLHVPPHSFGISDLSTYLYYDNDYYVF